MHGTSGGTFRRSRVTITTSASNLGPGLGDCKRECLLLEDLLIFTTREGVTSEFGATREPFRSCYICYQLLSVTTSHYQSLPVATSRYQCYQLLPVATSCYQSLPVATSSCQLLQLLPVATSCYQSLPGGYKLLPFLQ